MKKFFIFFASVLFFFSCNTNVLFPDPESRQDGSMRLVLGSADSTARAVTEGIKVIDLAAAKFLRVRFIVADSVTERSFGNGLVLDQEVLKVFNVKSGFYDRVEVDIVTETCTFTAVANGVMLSAARSNILTASIEKTTPHLLVQADNKIYAFPDFETPDLCYKIENFEPPKFKNVFVDKWGGLYYVADQLLCADTSTTENREQIQFNSQGDNTFDIRSNTICTVEPQTAGSTTPTVTVQKLSWENTLVSAQHYPCPKMAWQLLPRVVGDECFVLMALDTQNPPCYIQKYKMNAANGTLTEIAHSDELPVPPYMTDMFYADGEIFFFDTNLSEIYVLDARTLRQKAHITCTEAISTIAMLGKRNDKVYFAVEVYLSGGGTSQGIRVYENGRFSAVNTAPLLNAMKKAAGAQAGTMLPSEIKYRF